MSPGKDLRIHRDEKGYATPLKTGTDLTEERLEGVLVQVQVHCELAEPPGGTVLRLVVLFAEVSPVEGMTLSGRSD